MLILDDATATEGWERWCESEVNADVPCHVASGGDFDSPSTSQSLRVLSVAQERSLRSGVQQRPLTMFSWPRTVHVSSREGRSQVFITPSPEPEAKRVRELGSWDMV